MCSSDLIKGEINNVVTQLIDGKPIQYIFGETYFHGNKFIVTPDTLIPRPETEELVDIIIKDNSNSDLKVLDIGTGSGCIAISLAKSLKFPVVTAFDISNSALMVAKENSLNLKTKVKFELCDILKAIPTNNSYDIIVSNPPYSYS